MKVVSNNYAGIGRRAIAMLIDAAILSVLGLLLFNKDYSITGPGLNMGLVPLLIAWLYFALQESSKHQATIGKRVMDIYVASKDGEKVDFKQSSIRYFAKLMSSLIALLGYAVAFFSKERLTLHDHLAGTVVLED